MLVDVRKRSVRKRSVRKRPATFVQFPAEKFCGPLVQNSNHAFFSLFFGAKLLKVKAKIAKTRTHI